MLERTVAAYICSPSNPEGAVASEAYWRTLFELADRFDFTVFADECYADIYLDKTAIGALTRARRFLRAAAHLPFALETLGHAGAALRDRRRRCDADGQVPRLPQLRRSAGSDADHGGVRGRLSDEAHVEANRAAYREKFRLAQRMLGNRAGFRTPEGGFFLWLDVGNGEETALKLWREAGVRTLPGAYMGRESERGKPRTNPGFSYLRVALVNDLSTISTALERMVEVLGNP